MKQWATGGNVGRPQDVVQPGRAAGMPGAKTVDDLLFMRIVVDATAGASRAVGIPARIYRFVTIFNNSRFDFSLSRGIVFNPLDIIGNCPAYTLLTFPFDQETSDLFIRWDGVTGTSERALIFLTDDNLGLVGQFRPPAAVIPDTPLFTGAAFVGNLVTAANRTIIRAIYIANTHTAASTITLVHRRAIGDIVLLPNISIAIGTTHALGYVVLAAGDSLAVTAFGGAITVSVYGEEM